ncbi:MAG: hypothetical protein AB8H86_21825 [Polyangiales bacterium]
MRNIALVFLFGALLVSCSESSSPNDTPYGSPCAAGCASLFCAEGERFPDGYCTAACPDGVCSAGSSCVEEFGSPLCLASCADPTACREGYQCWRGTCRPDCISNTECGPDTVCESGTCTGAECTTNAECGAGTECVGNRCVPAASMDGGVDALPDTNQPDIPPIGCGDCDGVCDGDVCLPGCVDRASCGSASLVCAPVGVDDDGDGTADRAVAACIDSRPAEEFLGGACADDSECESSTCYRNQCTEICDGDDDCLPGHTCRPVSESGLTYRACWYSPATSSVDEYILSDTATSSGQMLPRGVIAVPPDAISLTLVVEQAQPLNMNLTFFQVFDPTGAQLFSLEALAGGTDQPIRWYPSGERTETATMLIPNSTPDRVELASGRHVVLSGTFFDETGPESQVTVRALVRRSTTGEGGGDLRLRVHVAPGLGFTAGNAHTVDRLQSTLERLDEIYAEAGINIIMPSAGDYVDISDNRYSIINSTQGPGSELAGLFRQSAPSDEQVVNVFLVRGFDEDGGGGTLGVAGGIPGPVDVHGTAHSGVVISFDTQIVGNLGRFAGQILAHELGHYLGLFHSTERSTDNFGGNDPIADTRLNDNRNLMFYAVQRFGGNMVNDSTTAGQRYVISRSATVR